MKEFYVAKNGEQFGPFSESQLRAYIHRKTFSDSDLACYDGKNWVLISQLGLFEAVSRSSFLGYLSPKATPQDIGPDWSLAQLERKSKEVDRGKKVKDWYRRLAYALGPNEKLMLILLVIFCLIIVL